MPVVTRDTTPGVSAKIAERELNPWMANSAYGEMNRNHDTDLEVAWARSQEPAIDNVQLGVPTQPQTTVGQVAKAIGDLPLREVPKIPVYGAQYLDQQVQEAYERSGLDEFADRAYASGQAAVRTVTDGARSFDQGMQNTYERVSDWVGGKVEQVKDAYRRGDQQVQNAYDSTVEALQNTDQRIQNAYDNSDLSQLNNPGDVAKYAFDHHPAVKAGRAVADAHQREIDRRVEEAVNQKLAELGIDPNNLHPNVAQVQQVNETTTQQQQPQEQDQQAQHQASHGGGGRGGMSASRMGSVATHMAARAAVGPVAEVIPTGRSFTVDMNMIDPGGLLAKGDWAKDKIATIAQQMQSGVTNLVTAVTAAAPSSINQSGVILDGRSNTGPSMGMQ